MQTPRASPLRPPLCIGSPGPAALRRLSRSLARKANLAVKRAEWQRPRSSWRRRCARSCHARRARRLRVDSALRRVQLRPPQLLRSIFPISLPPHPPPPLANLLDTAETRTHGGLWLAAVRHGGPPAVGRQRWAASGMPLLRIVNRAPVRGETFGEGAGGQPRAYRRRCGAHRDKRGACGGGAARADADQTLEPERARPAPFTGGAVRA